LPFLQRVLGDFKLVPVVMGEQDYAASRALGVALARLVDPSDTLIVASSDLSHYHPYDEALKLDGNTLKAVEEWDYLSLARNFEARVWEACGGAPIVAAMIAAERLGATEAHLLRYANSGDLGGDRARVVGYGAVAFTAAGRAAVAQPKFDLSRRDQQALLALARKSVETAVREHKLYEPAAADFSSLAQERGAFVTLKKNGQLRGCIGYTSAVKPLYLTVRDVAAYAALRDTRFPPVSAAELRDLEYEVSVLSPMRHVRDVKEIEVGRHGLLMKSGNSEGLLLPQVPVEQHWDRNTFLQETAMKAGMRASAWREENTDIFRFEAFVFGEHTAPVTPGAGSVPH
jgi:AmmeMemoRadiSam system protein A